MMSLETTLLRIAQINSLLAPRPGPYVPPPRSGAQPSSFANALQGAMGPSPVAALSGGGVGGRIVALAQAEVGQKESPPGSNNSSRIAQYRTATAGSAVGPWCAYFASWIARQAGVPIGDGGRGLGLVDAVWAWGQRTGKAIRAGAGDPKPGDLIIWDEHMGIVESVRPDGTVTTIEGNSSDQVARRTHRKGDAIGYVRLG
jgi:hypothetical protein